MQMLNLVDMIIKYKKENTVQPHVMLFETDRVGKLAKGNEKLHYLDLELGF